jgi:hypothetical protein
VKGYAGLPAPLRTDWGGKGGYLTFILPLLLRLVFAIPGSVSIRFFRQKPMWLSQPSDFYFFCQLVAFAQSLNYPFIANVAFGFLNVATILASIFGSPLIQTALEEVSLFIHTDSYIASINHLL